MYDVVNMIFLTLIKFQGPKFESQLFILSMISWYVLNQYFILELIIINT